MQIKKIPQYVLQTLKNTLNRENLPPKKVLCYSSIFISLVAALLGFFSTVFSFYIGDIQLQIILITIGVLFCLLIYYSLIKLHKRKESISLIIFTCIVFFLAYALPLIPPKYGLQQFEINAAFLKFMIVSILLVIVGIFGVSFAMKPLYNFTSKSNQSSAYFILTFSLLLILYPLVVIIGNIMINGLGGISWDFLTQDVIKHGAQGGINHALFGTFIVTIGTAIIAIPLGVASAIYLIEYAKAGPIVRIIRIAADILQGIPSIVFGLFGLAVFVPIFGISILSGILVMGFMTLPIVIRGSEEALLCVPKSIREGSYAVGATKWQTIRRVVLPPALPGIITGAVLGLGRAAGETAPIMFTASIFMAPFPTSVFEPIQSLSFHLLQLTKYIGAYPVEQNAWATALLLIGIVLGMNAIAIIVREKYRVEF
ncbi:Binding-protein-dependent transport system inner membrane component [uncultured archaeon]|nr:Binding-protein-dependent transport system inner membrane component [uncultured archaeon]